MVVNIMKNYLAGLVLVVATLAGSGMQPAQASSPDAWKEFQQNVETACLSASSGTLDVKGIQVDPHGSESYGFAILLGIEVGTSTEVIVVCTYDKASEVAEISTPFRR